MPGGLMQLVNKGAQDQLVTGSPSFTHFKSMYKRHTEFAQEHFRLDFRSTNLDLGQLPKTFRVKVDRNAQLVHDMYIHVSLPDIFSPIQPVSSSPLLAPDATGIGYEFQWIKNIGYNMIRSVSVLLNGTAIVTHTGEWMKLYSYITHSANRRKIIDKMVGNLPELYDPANAFNRRNQYPHSITNLKPAEPSIPGRDLVIPLHFWFCEEIGAALPLVALQYSEVEIVIEFVTISDLFTVRDVRPNSPRFGQRIRPDIAAPEFAMANFLSTPDISGNPTNPTLTTWSMNPYIEANYIFLSDPELIHLAKSDNSFKIKDVRYLSSHGLYGGGNDIELAMHNLCTRIVWVGIRSDVFADNDFDNYTNTVKTPYSTHFSSLTPWYSSGELVGQNQSSGNIIIDGTIVLDGAERFKTKPSDFFELQENYKYHTGYPIDGVYTYSFALDHTEQPSGHINGSMFNRTILRLTMQLPPFTAQKTILPGACIIKSTALSQNPVAVQSTQGFNRDEVLTVVTKPDLKVYEYTYTINSYVESYNFLRIYRGIGNVVFSS
jgi:hypothetical protein